MRRNYLQYQKWKNENYLPVTHMSKDPNPTWLTPGLRALYTVLTEASQCSREDAWTKTPADPQDTAWNIGLSDFQCCKTLKAFIRFGCFVCLQVGDRAHRILKIMSSVTVFDWITITTPRIASTPQIKFGEYRATDLCLGVINIHVVVVS